MFIFMGRKVFSAVRRLFRYIWRNKIGLVFFFFNKYNKDGLLFLLAFLWWPLMFQICSLLFFPHGIPISILKSVFSQSIWCLFRRYFNWVKLFIQEIPSIYFLLRIHGQVSKARDSGGKPRPPSLHQHFQNPTGTLWDVPRAEMIQ